MKSVQHIGKCVYIMTLLTHYTIMSKKKQKKQQEVIRVTSCKRVMFMNQSLLVSAWSCDSCFLGVHSEDKQRLYLFLLFDLGKLSL